MNSKTTALKMKTTTPAVGRGIKARITGTTPSRFTPKKISPRNVEYGKRMKSAHEATYGKY